jgi:hypothetical protein
MASKSRSASAPARWRTGSGMPDLGHDAYFLRKTPPGLEFKDTNGKARKLSEKYEVVHVGTEAAG